MAGPVFLPVIIRRSRLCERCGLRFPGSGDQCPHCSQLSDGEVLALKEREEERQKVHAWLGRASLAIAAITAVVLLINFL